nr:hypothetical protein PanWU01x14_327130 [Ipomoea batatas]
MATRGASSKLKKAAKKISSFKHVAPSPEDTALLRRRYSISIAEPTSVVEERKPLVYGQVKRDQPTKSNRFAEWRPEVDCGRNYCHIVLPHPSSKSASANTEVQANPDLSRFQVEHLCDQYISRQVGVGVLVSRNYPSWHFMMGKIEAICTLKRRKV